MVGEEGGEAFVVAVVGETVETLEDGKNGFAKAADKLAGSDRPDLEAQRVGEMVGDQRFRQSMSFAVSKNATASANWARRCLVRRSVFRRS